MTRRIGKHNTRKKSQETLNKISKMKINIYIFENQTLEESFREEGASFSWDLPVMNSRSEGIGDII